MALREHPSDSMPREVRGWLASFIEAELCLKQRPRGRPPRTLHRQIQTTMRVEILNARVDRWRRACCAAVAPTGKMKHFGG
jgi:hypothetical protein